MSGIEAFLAGLGWSGVTYVCCMLFDMLAMNRAGFAYIAPRGSPTIEPKFWTGWSVRHVLLVPVSVLLQYLVRGRVEDFSPAWYVVGSIVIVYIVLFTRDLLRQVRPRDGD